MPETYKTKTQWGALGMRLKPNAKAIANFYSSYHNEEWSLYSSRSVEPKRKVTKATDLIVPEILTVDMVLEALYILNKNVKNLSTKAAKEADYNLKSKTIAKLVSEGKHIKTEKHFAGPYNDYSREYIIAAHYRGENGEMDEEAYYCAIEHAHEDERGRPYIEGETKQVYDLLDCVYFNGYSFHTPIIFRTSMFRGEPVNAEWLDKNSYVKLTDDQFVATRKKVTNVRLARKILNKYNENNNTPN